MQYIYIYRLSKHNLYTRWFSRYLSYSTWIATSSVNLKRTKIFSYAPYSIVLPIPGYVVPTANVLLLCWHYLPFFPPAPFFHRLRNLLNLQKIGNVQFLNIVGLVFPVRSKGVLFCTLGSRCNIWCNILIYMVIDYIYHHAALWLLW